MTNETAVNAHPTVQTTESLMHVVLRRKRMAAIIAASVLLVAIAYLLIATRTYDSRSRLYIEATGSKLLGTDISSERAEANLNTQSETLRSAPIAVEALRRANGGSLRTLAGVADPVAWLQKRLVVEGGQRNNLITVSLASPWPEEGTKLVGAVVETYVDDQTSRRRSTATEMLRVHQKQRAERDAEFQAVTQQLRELQKAQREAGGDDRSQDELFTKLAEAAATSEMRRIEAQAQMDSARAVADSGGAGRLVELEAGRGALQLDNEYQRLQVQLGELQGNLSHMKQRLGDSHPSVRGVETSLLTVARQVQAKQQRIAMSFLQNLQSACDAALRLEEQTKAALAKAREQQNQRQASTSELQRLQAEANRIAEQRDALDKRIQELSVAEDAGAVEISIVEPAHAETKPSNPKPLQVLAIGLVLGIALGVLSALIGEWFDVRFRGTDEIRAALGLPVLCDVPLMKGKPSVRDRSRVAQDDRGSETSEAYRDLRTAIMFSAQRENFRTMLITSSIPGEGKSTLACNLAIAMAQAGKRVLLIDADLRKPSIHQVFAPSQVKGLTNVLAGDLAVADAVVDTDIQRLHLLAAGDAVANPSELLGSEEFMRLLEELGQAFDHVIVDSPPVTAVTDGRILAAICDATLLVVRPDRGDRGAVMLAKETLLSVGAKIIGVVVNAAPNHFGYGNYPRRYGYGYPSRAETRPAAARSERPINVSTEELEPTCQA